MVKVFVYGMLLQRYNGRYFGIKSEYVIGPAILDNYKRESVSYIHKRRGYQVNGELIDIPEDLEKEIGRLEESAGWFRENVKVLCNGKKEKAIAYLV